MSTDRDVTRIVRSWLDEGVTQLPDRVLDLVLDQVPTTPQRRAGWLARRFPQVSTYARVAVVVAAVVLAAAVGIGIYANSVGRPGPLPAPSPTLSLGPSPSSASSATPVQDPIVGIWNAPEVTCAQQVATIEAAGFTAEEITLSGWTCRDGSTNQYSFQIPGGPDPRLFEIFDGRVQTFVGFHHLVGGTTFEVRSYRGDYCLTYRYVIDGDQLTIEMIDSGCPATGEAPLNNQVFLTAIFETSPFTRLR